MLRWLTNAPRNVEDWNAMGHETQEESVARHRQYLEDKIIGEPKATPAYTVAELKAMDLVGVYVQKDSNA